MVWPGILFPNNRGNEAAANLRLVTTHRLLSEYESQPTTWIVETVTRLGDHDRQGLGITRISKLMVGRARQRALTLAKVPLSDSKAVSSSEDFLKPYSMQKKKKWVRQKKIQLIPCHFNNLNSNCQKQLFLQFCLRSLWLTGLRHWQMTPTHCTQTRTKIQALARVKSYCKVKSKLWADWKYPEKFKICTARPQSQGLSATLAAGETMCSFWELQST